MLATNVAETSLTVPGIRYVVDPGTARISRYNRRTKVQRLPIEADLAGLGQPAGRSLRAGRARHLHPPLPRGRLRGPARPSPSRRSCARTWPPSSCRWRRSAWATSPRSPSSSRPTPARSGDGVALLEELGALDPDRAGTRRWLTPLGRRLARLPIDPRLGRMVLEAGRHGCVREVSIIAAALSIQDPRERPTGKEQAAAEQHRRFNRDGSDLLAWVALWEHLAGAAARAELQPVPPTLQGRVPELPAGPGVAGPLQPAPPGDPVASGSRTNRSPADADSIHRSLLAGLLSHIGLWDPVRSDYRGARQARFVVAPGLGAAPAIGPLGDGGGAGRDEPAVGPRRRPHPPRVGRAGRRPPGEAQLRRTAVGPAAGRRRGRPSGSRSTACPWSPVARSATTRSTRPRPVTCSSATRWWKATGPTTTAC